jgi:hypothetical protein
MRDTFLAASGPDGQPPIPSAGGGVFGDREDWFQMMADLQDKQTAIVDFKRHIEDVRSYVLGHRGAGLRGQARLKAAM